MRIIKAAARYLVSVFLLSALTSWASFGQTRYEIDLTHNVPEKPVPFNFSGVSPAGIKLTVNSRYFERNGKPWLPLMGEFHYSRYPAQFWEEEILKMKAAGISIIATYVFWNIHENPKGAWNWSGDLDLRNFIQLCRKHQMYVWLRIGPYDNAELVNGGLPDWIERMKGKRTNDPAYLAASAVLYKQIGEQTKGLYFKDGGPVIGIQLENEYASGEKDHIGTLKEMAIQSGIVPVYFSITANTTFHDEKFEAIPLQGAYPYRGWEKAGGSSSRDFLYGDDQWILTGAIGKLYYDITKYPKGLCEQGCGSQVTYENRFVVNPEIVEAHLQNQIGRGMNLIGYYMFQGGTQIPEFKRESCPVSYDFQAPLSEFGYARQSYRDLKILHHFVNDFGGELAPMQVVEPARPVRDEHDTTHLRYIVRTLGNKGFVFMCNAQARTAMPDKAFRMLLNLKDETIEFPRKQLILKGGTTAIIPFNLSLNGTILKYATAQPLSRFTVGNTHVLFLTAVEGMSPELAFDEKTVSNIRAAGWQIEKSGGKIFLTPKGGNVIRVQSSDGRSSEIVLLTRKQAENSWRTKVGNQEVMIISHAGLKFNNNSTQLSQFGSPEFSLDIFPSSISVYGSTTPGKQSPSKLFTTYTIRQAVIPLDVKIKAVTPDVFSVQIPKKLPASLNDIALQINYLGGEADATLNGKILTDDLYNGTPWMFGLKRYLSDNKLREIQFKALPWQDNTTGVADTTVLKIKQNGPKILSIKPLPEYRTKIELKKTAHPVRI